MKKFITNKYVLTILGIFLFLFLWWMISLLVGQGERIFPSPWITFKETFKLLKEKSTYLHISYSLLRMLIGFVIAVILGVLLGVVVGNYRKSRYIFNPTMIALKTIPTAALVFLFLVLIGAKNTPILIVALITFPLIYESVVGGYTNIDKNILMSLRIDGNNKWNNNLKVKFPLAFPYLLVGLVSSFSLSFKVEIMAEVISGSTSYGLGNIIKAMQQNDPSNLTPIFAYSLYAILLMLLISLGAYYVRKKLPYIKA